MKKLLFIAFIASSFISLQSCGGDDNIVPNGNNGGGNNGGGNNGGGNNGGGNNGGGNNGNTTTANLPILIEDVTGGKIVFEYDSKDRFQEIEKLSPGSSNHLKNLIEFIYSNDTLREIKTIDYTYTTNNRLINYSFSYTNNEVKVDVYDSGQAPGWTEWSDQLLIDDQGRIIQNTRGHNSGYGGRIEEFFYDNNGNIISYNAPPFFYTMTYDSSNAIFKNVNNEQWAIFYVLFHSVGSAYSFNIYNNVIEITNANDSQFSNYTYNSENYPITMESNIPFFKNASIIAYSK